MPRVPAPRHGAVLVHDFDDDAGRLETGHGGEVAGGFGMTGAHEHAAGLRGQRKDVAGLGQMLGSRVLRHGRANRMRAVIGRNAGGHAFGRLDRHREVGVMR